MKASGLCPIDNANRELGIYNITLYNLTFSPPSYMTEAAPSQQTRKENRLSRLVSDLWHLQQTPTHLKMKSKAIAKLSTLVTCQDLSFELAA